MIDGETTVAGCNFYIDDGSVMCEYCDGERNYYTHREFMGVNECRL